MTPAGSLPAISNSPGVSSPAPPPPVTPAAKIQPPPKPKKPMPDRRAQTIRYWSNCLLALGWLVFVGSLIYFYTTAATMLSSWLAFIGLSTLFGTLIRPSRIKPAQQYLEFI